MPRLTTAFATLTLLLATCAPDTPDPVRTTSSARSGTAGRTGPGSQDDLARYAGDRVFFDTDQSVLTPEALQTLDRQVEWLRQYPRINVWVAGNSDERGTEEYNLALGHRRAEAGRDYLASKGIDPRRIEVISYGKSRPVDPLSSTESWARNRNAITSVR